VSELLRGIFDSPVVCPGDAADCRDVKNSAEFECVNFSGVVPVVLDCTLGGGGGGVMPFSTPCDSVSEERRKGERREEKRRHLPHVGVCERRHLSSRQAGTSFLALHQKSFHKKHPLPYLDS
jgi:hypothetical protein